MKDLYRRNNLRARESDRIKIHSCDGSEEDKEAAFTILLNADKKAEYDRVHTSLSAIGYIRRHLGLAGRSNWRKHYGDFLQPSESSPPVRNRARKFVASRRFNFASLVSWPVVIFSLASLLPLSYLALVQGGPDALAERQSFDQRMYTSVPQVPVYATADASSRRLGQLREFQDVSIDPRHSSGQWAYVKLDDESAGYVQKQFLAQGSGEAAQVAKCRGYGLWRPESGQQLTSGKTGTHQLLVANPPGKDALVKLKDHEGNTEVFFYVRGGETAAVKTIPEGRFQLQYALGENYSPACGRFLDQMRTLLNPQFITFSRRSEDAVGASSIRTVTLKVGSAQLNTVSNRDF